MLGSHANLLTHRTLLAHFICIIDIFIFIFKTKNLFSKVLCRSLHEHYPQVKGKGFKCNLNTIKRQEFARMEDREGDKKVERNATLTFSFDRFIYETVERWGKKYANDVSGLFFNGLTVALFFLMIHEG